MSYFSVTINGCESAEWAAYSAWVCGFLPLYFVFTHIFLNETDWVSSIFWAKPLRESNFDAFNYSLTMWLFDVWVYWVYVLSFSWCSTTDKKLRNSLSQFLFWLMHSRNYCWIYFLLTFILQGWGCPLLSWAINCFCIYTVGLLYSIVLFLSIRCFLICILWGDQTLIVSKGLAGGCYSCQWIRMLHHFNCDYAQSLIYHLVQVAYRYEIHFFFVCLNIFVAHSSMRPPGSSSKFGEERVISHGKGGMYMQ